MNRVTPAVSVEPKAGPNSQPRGLGPTWIVGRANFFRDLCLVGPLDREPDLILFGTLYNTADMKPRNITNANAFADNTTKSAHPCSPFRGKKTSFCLL